MGRIDEIADDYIVRMAALDPISATSWGVAGHDDQLPDMSPGGLDARAALKREALAALADAPKETEDQRVAADVMSERLASALEQHEARDDLRGLRVIGSPHGAVRQVFDLMRFDTEEDWQLVAARLAAVPAAVGGCRATLAEGIARKTVAAQRQAKACAEQCTTWGRDFFHALVARYPGSALKPTLDLAADNASDAYTALGAWLTNEYSRHATPVDAVGRERYAMAARQFTGAVLDLEDTYTWGWEELRAIENRMAEVCERIAPGESLAEVITRIEADPALVIEGVEAFQRWNQDLINRTVAALDGVQFEIAERIRRCEAMIAPPGSAAAMYYTGPSEDFSRPGRTWYPTMGKTRFPLWREVSICYHEAVPGHHLQVARVRLLADRLTRFQRLAGFISGHGEGWALYAERLMDELGYLDHPAFELGMLSAQAMRAVRVIVDIGMHLELRIPDDDRYHPGETWTPELALPFVIERSCFPADFMASEVDRYLGMPGQAISYKVGERVWLAGRAEAQKRKGASFDLKEFHSFALDLGGMGLDQLTRELARY